MGLLTKHIGPTRHLGEHRRNRRRIAQTIAILITIAALFVLNTKAHPYGSRPDTGRLLARNRTSTSSTPNAGQPSFLHLLLPASTPDVKLCKTLLSAAVLNYSTPALINWKHSDDSNGQLGNRTPLTRAAGVLKYLNDLGPEDDHDLAVIADGYDVWFQLGPEFLLSRYYESNRLAGERMSRQMCGRRSCDEALTAQLSQQVVFSSQKGCWPHAADKLACFAPPLSTLPSKVYGRESDNSLGRDEDAHYFRMRPRHLSPGFVIGKVGALRRLYAEVDQRMTSQHSQRSESDVLGDIFGAQEYARELLRRLYLTSRPTQRLINKVTATLWKSPLQRERDAIFDRSQPKEVLSITPTTNFSSFEYNIGIDYDNSFSMSTAFSPRDSDWMTFSQTDARSGYGELISRGFKRSSLPPDLATAPVPPFNNLSVPAYGRVSANLPPSSLAERVRIISELPIPLPPAPQAHAGYAEIPLFTNLFLSTVPVAIQHQSGQDGMLQHSHHQHNRETMWGQPWWSAYARSLLKAHVDSTREPVAVLRDPETGALREFWSPVEKKGGARLDNGTWVDMQYLCGVPPPTTASQGFGQDSVQMTIKSASDEERRRWQEELYWVDDEWDRIWRETRL